MAEFKAKLSKGDTLSAPLTIGQFHFAQGLYAGSAITPPGKPPGDGALVLQTHNNKHLLVWTSGDNACLSVIVVSETAGGQPQGIYMPMPISEDQAKLLDAVRTGKDETTAPADDRSEDMHL